MCTVSVGMRCAPQPPPMRSPTTRTLPRYRSGWGTTTLPRHDFPAHGGRKSLSVQRAVGTALLFHLSCICQAKTSVPEWDRQFRLIRVHHEHREKLGRLRLTGIGADAVAVP